MGGEVDMSLKKNLDVVIYEHLREKIIRGEWTPGQPLSADDISEHYGVSKTPVLQAMKKMQALKMLTVTSTGHYFVPEYSEEEIYNMIEIRALLERQAISDIRDKNIGLDFDRLEEIVSRCSAANSKGDIVNARKADLEFHMHLIASVRNGFLTDLYDRLQGQFIVANYLITAHTQEQQRVASDDHEKILDALRSGDYGEAIREMDGHIYGARDKMIRKMRIGATGA